VTQRNDVATKDDRTLVITRVFDAPLALVWECWTQKQHLDIWSCPRGFTIPRSNAEFRPGGKWHVVMRTPDGHDLGLGGTYREIVPMKRLVMTHVWDEEPVAETLVTVTFEASGDKTRVTLEQTGFATVQSRDGHTGGWGEALDILAEHLAELRQ
jgi:uncharacterized protein YndB with AHSA1/START domain